MSDTKVYKPSIRALNTQLSLRLCTSVAVREYRNGDVIFDEGTDPDGPPETLKPEL